MDKHALLAEVRSARSEVTRAEEALAKLLRDLQANVRAEKTTVSKVIATAFKTLRAARQHLIALENLAGADEQDDR